VGAPLDRNDQRRPARRAAWRQSSAQARAREAANERLRQAAGHRRTGRWPWSQRRRRQPRTL